MFKNSIIIFVNIIIILFANNCIAIEEMNYPQILGFSSAVGNNRALTEMNLMLPLATNQNNLAIIDIKIKGDTKRNLGSNLGFIFRHNFLEKTIFGAYSYLDVKQTLHHLSVSQLTIGFELLHSHINTRFNLYIPDNKTKLFKEKKGCIRQRDTREYIEKATQMKEFALKGYDFEIGGPLFIFTPTLHEKFSTEIYIGKYKFGKKNTSQNSAIRFRVAQKITDNLFQQQGSEIVLHLGSSYTNKKKWNSFISVGMRWILTKGYSNYKITNIQKRMMDNVVREVDIVTNVSKVLPSILSSNAQGKIEDNIYFDITKTEQFLPKQKIIEPLNENHYTTNIPLNQKTETVGPTLTDNNILFLEKQNNLLKLNSFTPSLTQTAINILKDMNNNLKTENHIINQQLHRLKLKALDPALKTSYGERVNQLIKNN